MCARPASSTVANDGTARFDPPLFGRAGETLDHAEYAALDAVHGVEGQLDEATGGRFYDAVEKADLEAGELLDRLHLDNELGEEGTDAARPDAPEPGDRPTAA